MLFPLIQANQLERPQNPRAPQHRLAVNQSDKGWVGGAYGPCVKHVLCCVVQAMYNRFGAWSQRLAVPFSKGAPEWITNQQQPYRGSETPLRQELLTAMLLCF